MTSSSSSTTTTAAAVAKVTYIMNKIASFDGAHYILPLQVHLGSIKWHRPQ
jgi:hypothetical protein